MLMQWGTLQFTVMPLNIHEWEEESRGDFAKKEVLGATPPYEFTGDDGEELTLRGRYYPHKVGGLKEYDDLKSLKAQGLAQQLMRGDGTVMGWYQCHVIHQQHTFLRRDGIGQVVTFEAMFHRAGIPGGEQYFSKLYQSQGARNG